MASSVLCGGFGMLWWYGLQHTRCWDLCDAATEGFEPHIPLSVLEQETALHGSLHLHSTDYLRQHLKLTSSYILTT